MYSSPGKLSCQLIVHAVSPIWKDGKQKESEILASAVKKSLNIAIAKGHSSISFPALGTGNFKFSLDKSTEILVSAISDVLSDNQIQHKIAKVYLCDVSHSATNAFTKALIGIHGNSKVEKNLQEQMSFCEDTDSDTGNRGLKSFK